MEINVSLQDDIRNLALCNKVFVLLWRGGWLKAMLELF